MSASTPSCVRQRVLLIDDDELIADSLRQYLSTNGCEVDVALDAASAEILMMSSAYQVVLVDPYLTGEIHRRDTALLEAVHRLQPSASVIVVTGYGSTALMQLATDARHSLVNKPQSVVALSDLIATALRNIGPSSATNPSHQRMNE